MSVSDTRNDDDGEIFFYGEEPKDILLRDDPFELLAQVEEEYEVPLAFLEWR